MARKTKKHFQRVHAGVRAADRYGIRYTEDVRRGLIADIQQDRKVVTFVERQSNRVTVWSFRRDGQDVPFVYDKIRKEIVTFLPQDYWTGRR